MKWLPYGPNAWLLQFAEALGDEAFFRGQSIVADLAERPPPGLVEFVTGFTTLLLEFDPLLPDVEQSVLPELTRRWSFGGLAKLSTRPVKEVPVRYNGPDLERVAISNELSPAEVVARHTAPVYRVYFLGFSPGFPYLGDLDPALHTPRLSHPRTKVEAGSVAIGGPHTGIYTVASPGGWNVIGHTPLRIFDPSQQGLESGQRGTFLLQPGDRVKFVPYVQ